MSADLLDTLVRVSEFLDNYVDVDDVEDGRPVPNRAMSLKQDVDREIDELETRAAANEAHQREVLAERRQKVG